ncbi:AMP-binding protein [Mycolicibacterium fluoranthenivorans]|uniref:Long-chain-fatty-acid--CoA ligase FadD13 n=1 Tax=Mycolicibacterium fluoranthenivorans TaxID=258505 RepID=A0A1G4X2L8_9MYCO|nr:AMP-binding protein [Mycolicibacterium fluoranthenivorans]SCX34318.1 Acyl-CoA synthetase (AMP-forming)/AMP-acid ligase II [Mycolicibacterium fluoranthenivorans]
MTALLHELITAVAAEAPDRPALIGPDGTSISFAQFDTQIRRTAAWVAAHSSPGDRMAVIADNGADYARVYYAVPRSGRVLVLINQRLSSTEQLDQLASVQPALVLGDPGYLAPLAGSGYRLVPFDSMRCHDLPDRPATAVVAPDDPAWLLFTSGSTGKPKGVIHTHRSLLAAVRGTIAGRSVRAGGVYLLPFPMCHIAGYNMLVHHAAGSTVLPVPAFRPDAFTDAVNTHGVTSCSLAPTMLHALLAHLEDTGTELPTLRDIAYGSAAIPADLLDRAVTHLGVGFHQGYGMTETGGNITFLGPEEHRSGDAAILATAGHPHSGVQIRIAGPGPIGEILVRGEQVATGYWPDLPATVDGWLHTGDIGQFDQNGRLVVSDRLKDVIITGGENVSSREVEDVLSRHPDVEQVAVVGVPDAYWGEAICAVVVARSGSAVSAADLVELVRGSLAGFKRPRHVLFVESLPLTSNGKIAKEAVRQYARGRLG